MKTTPHRVVLAVLDGWGLAPKGPGNAIALAKKPNYNNLIENYPNTTLLAAGEAVGLKPDESGNSEAGHLNLGAGRLVWQEKIQISRAIRDGSFFQNEVLLAAALNARKHRSALHLVGLLADGQSGHAEPEHLEALLVFCRQQRLTRVYLHLFTDGRDCPPKSAQETVRKLDLLINNLGVGRIATIGGRYYGMDRGSNWDRIGLMYEAMVHGQGPRAATAFDAIRQSYRRGTTDEFILPTIITERDGAPAYAKEPGVHRIAEKDSVIFFNLRSDRARQLVKAFVSPHECRSEVYDCARFRGFRKLFFATLSDFGKDLGARAAFVPEPIANTLPHYLGKYITMRQLYVAEREKFAHVTYFFHGGRADPERNETRVRVESLKVPTFDHVPAMSAAEITDAVVADLQSGRNNFIMVNYANADILGHSGQLRPTIKAVEYVDRQIGRLAEAALAANAALLITADHGNAEQMLDPYTGKVDTGHTANPVPFVLVSEERRRARIKHSHLTGASLRDAAPTILEIFGLAQPPEMTGSSLISS